MRVRAHYGCHPVNCFRRKIARRPRRIVLSSSCRHYLIILANEPGDEPGSSYRLDLCAKRSKSVAGVVQITTKRNGMVETIIKKIPVAAIRVPFWESELPKEGFVEMHSANLLYKATSSLCLSVCTPFSPRHDSVGSRPNVALIYSFRCGIGSNLKHWPHIWSGRM